MLRQIQIQINEGYKPYSQHVILSALLMVSATGIFAPVFYGYLIYYSFRVAKLAGWKNYWRIDWLLPVGWTWSLALVISFALSPDPDDAIPAELYTTYDWVMIFLFVILVLAISAWGLAIIILAAKRGTLDHYAFLAGPAKSSFIATSEIKRLFAPDNERNLQARK